MTSSGATSVPKTENVTVRSSGVTSTTQYNSIMFTGTKYLIYLVTTLDFDIILWES